MSQEYTNRRIPFARNYAVQESSAVRDAEPRAHFTQVTPTANVPSIRQNGLLANRGGMNGAGAALGGQAGANFQQRSQNYVHLGQDRGLPPEQQPTNFYTNFFQGRNVPAETLHVYMPSAQSARLGDDPDDTEGGRYRTNNNISPQQVFQTPLSVRPPGQIGADYAPPLMTQAINSHMPPVYGHMNSAQVSTAFARFPSMEDIERASSSGALANIARQLRTLANQGHYQNGNSQEYRTMSQRIQERSRENF